jgi:hypothetical protein
LNAGEVFENVGKQQRKQFVESKFFSQAAFLLVFLIGLDPVIRRGDKKAADGVTKKRTTE